MGLPVRAGLGISALLGIVWLGYHARKILLVLGVLLVLGLMLAYAPMLIALMAALIILPMLAARAELAGRSMRRLRRR